MKYSCVQLNDLPDEILLTIFKKLYNAEVLYSLIGVNKRLNKIAQDTIFTGHLTLIRCSLNDSIYPVTESMLDRFCSQILPEIHDKIKWFNLESFAMERILLAANYSNLSGLGLYNLGIEKAKHLFTDETSLIHTFKNQISSFVIYITKNEIQHFTEDRIKILFTNIFVMFINLKNITFYTSPNIYQRLSFSISPPIVYSSILLELRVIVHSYDDCLYLLDGRFNQLHTFNVNILTISSSCQSISNKEKLLNLKSFSLCCNMNTDLYDELILPLVHRMLNLEQLHLHLVVNRDNEFIDGNHLKNNIINHMLRLNKFTFNIRSSSRFYNQINFPSNDDIQKTFRDFQNNQITCCVDYLPKALKSQCHIYSYPYQSKYYDNITNNFPGGLFKCVREVSLFDERPFEHEFFFQIQKSFPLMEKLKIINEKPQNNKRFNQDLSIIKYSYLSQLDLSKAHKDYLEQFLLNKRTCLQNYLDLYVDYRSLKQVTHNFTRDTTRMNCSKVKYFYRNNINQLPKYFKGYFRSTNVLTS